MTFDDIWADQLLEGLVRAYSPSGEEMPASRYLVDAMQDSGMQAHIDAAGNAVGQVGQGERTVLCLGHIDTVPGNIPVRREGSILYGRGSVDAKGPLATFTVAAVRAAQQLKPDVRIIVVGAVEEEAATSKGARYILETLHKPEAVIIGEPSNWDRVTVAYKGRLLVDYELSQEISHTAGEDAGACDLAFEFWRKAMDFAEAYNAGQHRMFDQLDPSLRDWRKHSDGFTETAHLTGAFRVPLDIHPDTLKAKLTEFAGDARVQFRGAEQAYRGAKNNFLAKAFIKAVSAEGSRVRFKVKSGTSDMNVVGPVWQCPILAYGPGDSALDHTPNEHIDLNEYHQAIRVLTRVLTDI